MDKLSFYEYRRLLLNCMPENEFDQCNSAPFYRERLERLKNKKTKNCDALTHGDSYESCSSTYVWAPGCIATSPTQTLCSNWHLITLSNTTCSAIYASLADSYLRGGPIFYSSVLGAAAGITQHVLFYRKFVVMTPPNKILITYWKHRGLRVNRYLGGLVAEKTYHRVSLRLGCACPREIMP